MDDKQRITNVLFILTSTYPKATIELHYSTAWELLVAVMLSAQCTDKVVNIVTSSLFTKYSTFDSYVHADQNEFESDIRKTGFFRTKAAHILATAKIINTTYNGHVPNTMAALVSLPGVARKTANIVLGNAFGRVEGIAVDTHVSRISQRLRLVPLSKIGGKKAMVFTINGTEVTDYTKDADTNKIEQELLRVVPKKDWLGVTYRIIDHGRAICNARKPLCNQCPLQNYCPVSR